MTARVRSWLGPMLLVVWVAASTVTPTRAADREDAIQQVRICLRQADYPWYDRASDAPARFSPERVEQDENRRRNFQSWLSLAINIVALTVIVAGLGGLIYWLRKFGAKRKDAVAPAEVRQQGVPRSLPFPEDDVLLDFLQASREAARHGDFKSAIVYLFNHQLFLLDQQNLIRLHHSGTNGQYVRQLASRPVRPLFHSSVVMFEAVFFGGRIADAESYGYFTSLHDRIEQTLAAKGRRMP